MWNCNDAFLVKCQVDRINDWLKQMNEEFRTLRSRVNHLEQENILLKAELASRSKP